MHFPFNEGERSYAAESEIRASRVRQSDMWICKSPPPRIATKDRRSLTRTYVRAHTHTYTQCGFRESRSYTAVCSPWLWITSTTRQCEQNWKCQIRLLPRLYICAYVRLPLYVYTHMYIRAGTYTGWSA